MTADTGARDRRWRAPSVPNDPTPLAAAAFAVGGLTVLATWWVVDHLRSVAADHDVHYVALDIGLILFGLAATLLLYPAVKAMTTARKASAAALAPDVVTARVEGAAARTWCWYTMGYAVAVILVLILALLIVANEVAVGRTFFNFPRIADSFWLVLNAFWINVYICIVAEVLVLVWGLVVAIARMLPGAPARPIRFLATAYADIFRGLPAIITLYLVAFGLALAGLPVIRDLPLSALAIFALTLTYGAYVGEVYRAGIESIHWSQTAAARSLGLSYLQTLRFVIVPQAVRRIIPPLLNDFIGLQKDTALVQVVGIIDAFNQSKIIASNKFSLSPVMLVGILFVLFTIPQARYVDRLIAREKQRTQAGG